MREPLQGGKEMKNTARVLEHPLHPMLVPFPIAMFVAALVFNLIYLGTRNILWYDVGFYMILVGWIGGLAAALPGFVDYFTVRMSDQARLTATRHMLLNLLVVALFFVNWLNQWGHGATAGARLTWMYILDILGVVLLVASGWYGWELIYRYGIGISVEDAQREMEAAASAAPSGEPRLAGQMGGERPDLGE